MSNSHGTMGGVHDEWLTIDHLRTGRCGVSGVANAKITLKPLNRIIGEYVVDHSHAFAHIEVFGAVTLGGHNAGRLLSAMLQCYQSHANDLGDIKLRMFKIMVKIWEYNHIYRRAKKRSYTWDGQSPQAIAPKTPHSCVRPDSTAPRPNLLLTLGEFSWFSDSVDKFKINEFKKWINIDRYTATVKNVLLHLPGSMLNLLMLGIFSSSMVDFEVIRQQLASFWDLQHLAILAIL